MFFIFEIKLLKIKQFYFTENKTTTKKTFTCFGTKILIKIFFFFHMAD